MFTPPALGSRVTIVCPVPLIIVLAARLLEEEKYLVTNLSGYEAYRQKVHYRLVPFIW